MAKVNDIVDAFLALPGIDAFFAKKIQAGTVVMSEVQELPAIAAFIAGDGLDRDANHVSGSSEREVTVSVGLIAKVGAGENQNERIGAMIKAVEDAFDDDPGLGGLVKERQWPDWETFSEPGDKGEGSFVGAQTTISWGYAVQDQSY